VGWAGWASGALAALVAGGLFAVVCAGLIASGRIPIRAAYDQMHYHGPTVRLFASRWPSVDVYDYFSATTPGYHLALAALGRVLGPGVWENAARAWELQAGSAAIGAMLVGLLAWACARGAWGAWDAGGARGASGAWGAGEVVWRGIVGRAAIGAACALPLGCSMYVVQSGAWLLPDNAGWLLALATCLAAVRAVMCDRTSARVGWLVFAGVLGCALVWTRQSHAWALGVVWLAGWLAGGARNGARREGGGRARGAARERDSLNSLDVGDAWRALVGMGGMGGMGLRVLGARLGGVVIAALATVPAVASLAYLVWLWGGLTPYRFQFQHEGKSPAALGVMLAAIGVFSVVVWPIVLPRVVRVAAMGWREGRWTLVVATGVALVASVVPATTYSIEEGRWTGLWNVVRATPTVGGHASVVVVVMAVVGSWAMCGWLLAWRTWAERWIVAGMVVGCSAAVGAGSELWPRYVEPLALMVVGLSAARALGGSGLGGVMWRERRGGRGGGSGGGLARAWRWCAAGSPLVLAGVLAGLTVLATRTTQALADEPPPIKSEGDTGVVPLEVVVPPRGGG
jgi:hypothetical protein